MLKFVTLLLLTPALYAANYSYIIQVKPPFGNKIWINNSIPCPQQGAVCEVDNVAVNKTLEIKSIKEHYCSIRVIKDGSLKVDATRSYFCDVELTPASMNKPGRIVLPSHF